MNRESIDRWLERAILATVFGVLTFGALAFGGVRPSDFVVLWWLIIAALVLWIVRIWLAPAFRFLWPPLCWAIIPFILYAAWRSRTADVEFVARQEFIQILLAGLLLILVVNNLYSQESVRLMSLALVFLGMFVAMYGIYQWLRSSNTVWGTPRPTMYLGRASGSFICPNHLAGFLEMIAPLAVALVVMGRVRPVTRVLLAYASFVTGVGIAATQSRAGWLATGAAIMVLFFFLIRKRGQRWIALALLLAVTSASWWFYARSVAPRVQDTHVTGHSRDIRLRLWVSAWQMWRDNPWWGVGPDHFDFRFRQYREPVDRTQARPGRAHNDYINTLADYGAVGFVLALLPLGAGIWSVVRCWSYVQRGGADFGAKKSNRAAIVLGASAGLSALLVHSFFDFNMHIPANAFLATTLLAVLAGHIRFATERYWFTARWPLAMAGTLALVGSLCYLAPQAMRRTREVALLRRADALPEAAPEKIAALKNAFAVEPKNPDTAFAIGEQLRAGAWTGVTGYEGYAKEALGWFQRASVLNKWDPVCYIRSGMCLDWIGKHDEATFYFSKAVEIDPNHWYSRAMMGWHEFQLDHYKETREWMLKSLQLYWGDNPLAYTYLNLAEKMINEQNAKAAARK